jgi:predicted transcriptional regulator of viral defense system
MRLIDFIEEKQRIGKFWFTKSEAIQQLMCTKSALQQSIYDLTKKKRLVAIRGQFVLIIPFDYKNWGIIPADWFIDPLMKHLELPYYIALLSAAQQYNAEHQKPMQLQVITNQHLRDIKYGRIHIHFIQNHSMTQIPTQRVQVQTGYEIASTPEATAFDLCKYYKASGYWSNIGTVLAELIESIEPKKLCQIACSNLYDDAVIQRLGFMLSHKDVGCGKLADSLYKTVEKHKFRWVPLNPGQENVSIIKDDKWKILVNEDIEVDNI